MTKNLLESMEPTARLLMTEMRRERRSFWAIIAVFLTLLVLIGAFLLYNAKQLSDLAGDVKEKEFRQIGQFTSAMTNTRNSLNTQAGRNAADAQANMETRADLLVRVRVGLTGPEATAEALTDARKNFLGRPLNGSTAQLVAAVWDKSQGEDKLLLQAALASWRADDAELEQVARQLSDAHAVVRHAILAGVAYRKSQGPGANSGWDKGCKDTVEEVAAAKAAGLDAFAKTLPGQPGKGMGTDLHAVGLNLSHWQGHCLRKHGDAEEAYNVFRQMIDVAKAIPDSDRYDPKMQAYHGLGTTMAILFDMRPDNKNEAYLRDALGYLDIAGKLRMLDDESSKFGTTENKGFLLLRMPGDDRLMKVLDHTHHIDDLVASTWNLVVQLAAARGLQGKPLPASSDPRMTEWRDLYSQDGLDRLVFRTLAELAMRDSETLNMEEMTKLMGEYGPALSEAKACMRRKVENAKPGEDDHEPIQASQKRCFQAYLAGKH